MSEMAKRIFTLVFLIILSAIAGHAQTGQVKACRMTSRPLTLRKSQTWTTLKGTVPASGKVEYRLKPTSTMEVELTVAKTTIIKVDIYSLNQATKVVTRADMFKGTFSAGTEYSLVLSNCYGNTANAFQFQIRAQ